MAEETTKIRRKRRPRHPELRRDRQLSSTVTSSEYERIERIALAERKILAEFIRDSVKESCDRIEKQQARKA